MSRYIKAHKYLYGWYEYNCFFILYFSLEGSKFLRLADVTFRKYYMRFSWSFECLYLMFDLQNVIELCWWQCMGKCTNDFDCLCSCMCECVYEFVYFLAFMFYTWKYICACRVKGGFACVFLIAFVHSIICVSLMFMNVHYWLVNTGMYVFAGKKKVGCKIMKLDYKNSRCRIILICMLSNLDHKPQTSSARDPKTWRWNAIACPF